MPIDASFGWSSLRPELLSFQNAFVNNSRKVLVVIGALFVGVLAVTGVGLWRVETSLDKDKAKVLALADEFADCLYRGDARCLKVLCVWDENVTSQALERAKQLRTELGARGEAAAINNSWSMRKFNSLALGVTTTIRVWLATAYDNDPAAREWFDFVEKDGTLRVRNFRVSSQKVSDQAALAP